MLLLIFFLIGVTLTFYMAPEWPLVATLLLPLLVVVAGRFALFLFHNKDK